MSSHWGIGKQRFSACRGIELWFTATSLFTFIIIMYFEKLNVGYCNVFSMDSLFEIKYSYLILLLLGALLDCLNVLDVRLRITYYSLLFIKLVDNSWLVKV